MAEHPFRSNVLLWRVFRRELEETGVSLTCSQATIHGPRTTTGVLSSPKLLGGLTGNTDATGSPKHPTASTLTAARRGAAQPPTQPQARKFSSSTARRSRPYSCSRLTLGGPQAQGQDQAVVGVVQRCRQ